MIEYIIEFKLRGEPFYRKTFSGHKDKTWALKQAKHAIVGEIEKARVVEQTRKIIKVF